MFDWYWLTNLHFSGRSDIHVGMKTPALKRCTAGRFVFLELAGSRCREQSGWWRLDSLLLAYKTGVVRLSKSTTLICFFPPLFFPSSSLDTRYSSVVTRQRAVCVVLLCWVVSVLASFAQFIGTDVLSTRKSGGSDSGTAGLELGNNWTTSSPPPKYDVKVIGKYLPYGGFLSKFYVEDMGNFTYAELHSSHWAVCAPDTILSPQFLVYVHGMTVFMLPLLCLVAIYIDLLCMKQKTAFSHADPPKHDSCLVRFLALSLSLLVLLCLPLHVTHAVLLFTPGTYLPAWVHAGASFLFQLYGLVPQVLFTPPRKHTGKEQAPFPLAVSNLPPAVAQSRRKSVRMALCEAMHAAPWSSAKHSLKAKVCPEV